MAESFVAILRSATQSPDEAIARLPKIGLSDQKLLTLWNQTLPRREDGPIHQLIEAKASGNPESTAVCSWDGDLTYARLSELSSQLAHHLISLGVGPEIKVLVCMERSFWTPVALLAILKAGGAFVPLDPKLPEKRMQEIARRAEATIGIADGITSPKVITSVQTVLQLSHELLATLPIHDGAPATSAVQSTNTAYIIFTSGSTGVPKGVVIEHATVASSARAHALSMGINADSRVFHFSSLAFDASIAEILTTLTQGGCICVPSETQRLSSTAAAMTEFRVNWAFFTPSMAATLDPKALPYLKTLVLGGEAVTNKNIKDWAGSVSLHNGYGPTETCVFCVSTVLEPSPHAQPVLGRAIGSVAWVSDVEDASALCPIGAIGELLIQGPIVGRGYLGDDEATAKSFLPPTTIPSIRQLESHDRVYKTGDLVRFREDGSLIYVGRKGSQVKLRGQRIELEEVAHQIEAVWPDVERTVAEVIRPVDRNEAQMLVVFVQERQVAFGNEGPQQAAEPDQPDWLTGVSTEFAQRATQVRAQVAESIPHYMIPQVFIPVRHVPLSVNGKAERAKLRDWASKLGADKLAQYGQKQRAETVRKPTTDAEVLLQGFWEEVLQLPEGSVGADDHFFHLGADSLHVLLLLSVAEKAGMWATMSSVLGTPVLSEMALIFRKQDDALPTGVEVKPFEMFDDDGDLDLELSDGDFEF